MDNENGIEIEFDAAKNESNYRKHGLRFEDARHVFAGKVVTIIDDTEDYGEVRFRTFGLLDGIVVCIVHAERGDKTRVISMRRATKQEGAFFVQESR